MKLSFGLNGSAVECTIGHSLLIAAATHLKECRKTAFSDSLDTIANRGFSNETKDLVLNLLGNAIYNQMPTDAEVKSWINTLDGKKFALIYGTRNLQTPLTPTTADTVFDEMGDEGFEQLSNSLEELCLGTEQASLSREHAKNKLEEFRLEVTDLRKELETKRDAKKELANG